MWEDVMGGAVQPNRMAWREDEEHRDLRSYKALHLQGIVIPFGINA